MIALLAGFAVAAAATALLVPRLGPRAFLVAALAPLATFAYGLAAAPRVVDGEVLTQQARWVPELGLTFGFRLDGFALVMLLLVSGIGTLVLVYSAWYFEPRRGLARFAAVLTLFAGAMLGLVLADQLFALFVFWELTSITSYLLIGFDDQSASARSAALQALLTTGAGGLALLAGFVLLSQAAGTTSLTAILAQPPGGSLTTVALLLVLLGACTKSAQAPFHTWLPGAMAAPTPVSAYLHSATMVKAGIYLIARFSPAFAGSESWWTPLLLTVGCTTMVIGGLRAMRQHDLKLLLAFSTVSQLGLLVVVFAPGTKLAVEAGVLLLIAHAIAKAGLFLTVGVVDHATGTRDLRRLTGLGRALPVVAGGALVAGLSMAGIPPTLGFLAKEEGLLALLELHGEWYRVPSLVAVVAASALTVAYTARFWWGAFWTKTGRDRPENPVDLHHLHRPALPFAAPPVLLGATVGVLGIVPFALDGLVGAAMSSLLGQVVHVALSPIPHEVLPLLLSAVAIAGGAVLFADRRRVSRALRSGGGHVPGAQGVYDGLVTSLSPFARAVTAVAQPGSLPLYLMVILVAVVAAPTVVLLGAPVPSGRFVAADHWVQWVLVACIAVLLATLLRARRRFTAVVLLGGVGYLVAGLFVVQGAPDVALTQFLVETLSVLLFLLVLRHLPSRVEGIRFRGPAVVRGVVAVGTGAFVTVLLLVAGANRADPPPTDAYEDQALSEGGGKNIVNVILVDFRGGDTLGEITVLTVSAVGVVGLVLAGRTRRRPPARPGAPVATGGPGGPGGPEPRATEDEVTA